VKIRVLTNSLEATDVAAVHAGYAKRRRPLLEAGVTLFEMKRSALAPSAGERRITTGSGSSRSSLHAKTFAVDRSRVFVGSFNFDPRSARLNTELGFIIDSPAMAQSISDAFAQGIPIRAYEVRLSRAASLEWVEQGDGVDLVHQREPGTSVWQRLGVAVMSVLPIEWLL
jgi:putative cardiolipin synthase